MPTKALHTAKNAVARLDLVLLTKKKGGLITASPISSPVFKKHYCFVSDATRKSSIAEKKHINYLKNYDHDRS
jgi:hypothetical protein